MYLYSWLRHSVVLSILGAIIFGALAGRTMTARASAQLSVTPEGQGVRIIWNPTDQTHNIDLLFRVNDTTTPAFTIIGQNDTVDSSRLPLIDDASGNRNAASVGPVVRVRGQNYVVITLQPRVYASGNYHTVTFLEAFIDQVTYVEQFDQLSQSAPFLTVSEPPILYPATNLRIMVNKTGIQKITSAMLTKAGLPASGAYLSTLRLHKNDVDVPYYAEGLADGVLDKNDFIAFYVPENTDRWNPVQTYWLSVASSAGTQMTQTTSSNRDTPLTTGYEVQLIRTNSVYEPLMPGSDNDHWFMQRTRTDDITAEDSTGAEKIPFALKWKAKALPSTTIKATVYSTAMEYTAGPHVLTLQVGNLTTSTEWISIGDNVHTLVITDTRTAPPKLTIHSLGISEVLIDQIEFTQLATLASDTVFELPDAGLYQVAGKAAPDTLALNITDPANPVVLKHPAGLGLIETTSTNQRVLLATRKSFQTPLVTLSAPNIVDLTAADALYITPPTLLADIQPLVERRQTQGIDAHAVNLQAIYDGWSGGNVDPQAIHRFLHYVAHTWTRVPHTIILVGDGTIDPWNYSGSGAANINLIPPYVDNVDDYLGESACDTCYVRLDDADPLLDAAPDMSIGRMSVRTPQELKGLVNKIIRYEDQPDGLWQLSHVIASDDKDDGGDFPYFADNLTSHSSIDTLNTSKLYYDPNQDSDTTASTYTDAAQYRNDFLAQFNNGAGLLTYIGHSNHWQWASTANYSSYLLYLWDADRLRNDTRLPIVVGLSCLSSAFQRESSVGQTIDERLVTNPKAGAIAVWGSAGMEIATGHNQMFYNFYRTLRDDTQPIYTIGAATFAGMTYLAAASDCCDNIISSYTLIGDPLTKPRVASDTFEFVPTATPTATATKTAPPSKTPKPSATASLTPTASHTATPTLPGQKNRLLGWWRFEEDSTASQLLDIRGRLRLQCSTTPCVDSVADGVAAQAVALQSADLRTLDSSVSVAFNRDWSIALWVRTTATSDQTIISSVPKGPPYENQRVEIGTTAGHAFCGFSNGDDTVSSQSINDGAWHHIICSYAAKTTTRTLLIDGIPVAQSSATFAGKPSKIRVGGQANSMDISDSGRFSTADIDELVIFGAIPTTYDIQMLYNYFAPVDRTLFPTITSTSTATATSTRTATPTITPTIPAHKTSRMLGWWSFEDNSGSTIFVDVRKRARFQCVDPPCVTTINDGVYNNAARFDGNARRSMDSTLKVAFNKAWAVSFWVRTTATQSQVFLSSQGIAAPYDNARVVIGMTADGKAFCNFSSIDTTKSLAPINDGNWHHLLCSYDSKYQQRTLYVDGMLNNASAYILYTGNTAPVRIGGRSLGKLITDTDLYSTADIDELVIYGAIPTTYDIQMLYNHFAPTGSILYPSRTPTATRAR